MEKVLKILFFCFIWCHATAQKELRLKKGVVINSIELNNSFSESFSFYIPTKYNPTIKWPIIFVVNEGNKKSDFLNSYKVAAEQLGYILASSNNMHQTHSTSKNIEVFNRMYEAIFSRFSIDKNRIYTSGYSPITFILPIYVKEITEYIPYGALVSQKNEVGYLLSHEKKIDKAVLEHNSYINIIHNLSKEEQVKSKELYKWLNNRKKTIATSEKYIKKEYKYALEEDVIVHDYNNLGWWKYQAEKINKRARNKYTLNRESGVRLKQYVATLINSAIEKQKEKKKVNNKGLCFLWMLKTIVEPNEYDNYLKVIANSSKNGDFNTALYYLEELLKIGFSDEAALYTIENTSLLKITTEYNAIVTKYLKRARYGYDVVGK